MILIQSWRASPLAAILAIAVTTQGSAQEEPAVNSGLPGGASSLTETHGDWTVSCRIGRQGEAAVPVCAMSQQRANNQGQRTIAIELRPSDEGASGAMILPFGLTVTEGVVLRVDEGESREPLPFSTCLPAGCVVPLNVDSAMLEALSQGTTLTVTAQAVNGGQTELQLSLAGFTSAINRTNELLE